MKEASLLAVDSVINFLLGLPLMLIPTSTARFLGIPIPAQAIYASLLGAVLTGIGVALLIECFHERIRMTGLGFGGAIAINSFGAAVLMVWLLLGTLDIPLRGYVILWVIAVVVLGIGLVELRSICQGNVVREEA